MTGFLATSACAPAPAPRAQGDTPRRRRGIDAAAPYLAFHGRAEQMGDLAQVASTFRLIAIDADPAQGKFSRSEVAALRAGGRNIVLGILNVGFCDRGQAHWKTAPDGLLPCVSNLSAQIGVRAGRPQQTWMDLEDFEYQRLLVEHVAPGIEKAEVDGFLLDGLELLDHGPDDDAPCDTDCIKGGLVLLAALRKEFPDLVLLMQGGLSGRVRGASVERIRVPSLVDGVVGEEVYAPSYDAEKEADLTAWKKMGLTVNGNPLAVITQDYVGSCAEVDQARTIYQTSRAHGFSPAVGLSPVNRARVCQWGFAP